MEAPSFLKPLIESLPPDWQPFVNAGGWLIPCALVGFIILLFVWSKVRGLFRGRRPAARRSDLTEELGSYLPPPALWGTRRLTVHGMPVRIRLIVAAPLGHEGGYVHEGQIEQLLDMIVPGMGSFVRADQPCIRVWATQLSYEGFTASFRRHAVRPDGDRQISRWVMLMGKALINRRPVALGFALLADQENTLNRVILDQPHEWMQAVRVQG
jgi:hypothetical protein